MQFFLVLIAITPFYVVDSQATEDVPYLYYHDSDSGEIVIERADGTDRHVLVETGAITINGPGWSPSGEYFAWYETMPDGTTYHVIDWQGEIAISPLEGAFISDWWSDNLLFVVGEQIQIIDVKQDEVLLNMDYTGDSPTSTNIGIIPEKEVFYFYEAADQQASPSEFLFNLVDVNSKEIITQRFVYLDSLFSNCIPQLSTEGDLIYISPDGHLVAESFFEGDVFEVPSPLTQITQVDWYGNYAFIYLSESCQAPFDQQELWFADFQTGSLKKISIGVTNSPWTLPDFYTSTWWSPNGDYYVYFSGEGLILFSDETQQTVLTTSEVLPETIRWISEDELIFAGVVDEAYYVHHYSTSESSLSIWSEFEETISNNLSLSADHQYMAYNSWVTCKGACIVNPITKKFTPITFSHPYSTSSDNGWEVLWHPVYDWLIITGAANMPSRLINVTDVNGIHTRNIGGWCDVGSRACFGWLPHLTTELITNS